MNMTAEAAVFLAAAILVVPVFRRLGLGDVVGYLCAGLLIGPFSLALIDDVERVLHFAEIGVVFLLFVIGLELQPTRLWVFRRLMFGMGTLQLLSTMAVFSVIARLAGADWPAAVTIGGALALSSTALVSQLLSEQKELMMPHGRAAFGVLLLQDIAVIPLMALVGVLSSEEVFAFSWQQVMDFLLLLLKFGLAVFLGRLFLRYLLHAIASFRHTELFTATALFMVVGSGLLFEEIGLSMSLGAFTAGVLMADSEYRHQLEANIIPFKGLLLGLFFIAVGMSANLDVLVAKPLMILFVTVCLVLGKWLILMPIGYLFGLRDSHPRRLGILLAQGGEFAFVLLTPAVLSGLIEKQVYDMLVLSVTLSMICTPLLFFAEARWRASQNYEVQTRPFDEVEEITPRIIIAGFGRVGQIVARVLNSRGISFLALDSDPEQIDFVQRFGNKVYYGDACHLGFLEAAGIGRAEIFVCAIGDVDASMRIAEQVRGNYPDVKYYARARNRQHAMALRELGAKVFMRETFLSSLFIAEEVLKGIGLDDGDARNTVDLFKHHDEETLDQQYAIRDNEEELVQMTKESAEQLKYLFEKDRD